MSETTDIPWMKWVMHSIERLSSWRSYGFITVLFIISFICVCGRPYGAAELSDITGGLTVPDMSFAYTSQSVYTLLDQFGQAGRDLYLTRILPMDMVFALCYLLFFSITLLFLLKVIFPSRPGITGLALIPVIGGLADIIENICFVVILLAYPTPLPMIVAGAAICTKIKFLINVPTILFIPVAAVTAGVLTIKRRYQGKEGQDNLIA